MAGWLPAIVFGLGLDAGPVVAPDVYVPGDWPYAAVAPRSPAAPAGHRSPAALIAPRSTVARAERE